MLKKIFIPLLSLFFVAPAAMNFAYAKEGVKQVNADPEHNWDKEVIEEEGWNIIHFYTKEELVPTLKKDFCVPSGFAFYLEIEDETVSNIIEEIKTIPNYTYSKISFQFGYTFYGSTIEDFTIRYYNEDDINAKSTTGQPIDGMAVLIKENVHKHEIFKSNEFKDSDNVSAFVEIGIADADLKTHRLRLISKALSVEPFDETDYISLLVQHKPQKNTAHLTSIVINGFFNTTIYPNEYGFTIDDGTDFEHSFIANDSTTIARFTNVSNPAMELTIPEQGIWVKSKIHFISGGKEYDYYSHNIFIQDPGFALLVDGYANRDTVQKNTEHVCEFSLGNHDIEEMEPKNASILDINLLPVRLSDDKNGHELYENPYLPPYGEPGHYYYLPSDNEISLYNAGKLDELNNSHYEGQYYIAGEDGVLSEYNGLEIFNKNITELNFNPDFNKTTFSVPFIGKWEFEIKQVKLCFKYETIDYVFNSLEYIYQPLEVVAAKDEAETITLNVGDELNLLLGGNTVDVIPTLSDSEDEVYYFDWSLDKEGIISFTKDPSGKISITPERAGLVNLTVSAESKYLTKTTKTIPVRVMDSIYGVAKLVAPDGFHYVDEECTISVDIRGITRFQNIKIDWTVKEIDKTESVPAAEYIVNNDATLTLLKPKSTTYKITAAYEGVELGSIEVHFGYVDVDLFLRNNIWWIALITLGLVFVVVFLKHLTNRGRTTVQHIDYVYSSLSTFLSNDKLSKSEAKKTKRLITSCLNSCEDLNIEASNQYEKAIRYLRKSLTDIKAILNKWDKNDETEKSVLIDRLVTDLAKALNVAKEIETAREIIDANHQKANKKNFEYIETPKPEKKKKEKK